MTKFTFGFGYGFLLCKSLVDLGVDKIIFQSILIPCFVFLLVKSVIDLIGVKNKKMRISAGWTKVSPGCWEWPKTTKK